MQPLTSYSLDIIVPTENVWQDSQTLKDFAKGPLSGSRVERPDACNEFFNYSSAVVVAKASDAREKNSDNIVALNT